MGLSSRRKGKAGEQKLAEVLRRLGFTHAHRTAQFIGRGRAGRPDVSFGRDIGVRIECKYGDSDAPKTVFDNFEKLRQESGLEIPMLVMKRVVKENSAGGTRAGRDVPWLALIPLELLTGFAVKWLTGLGWSCQPPAKPATLLGDGRDEPGPLFRSTGG